MPKRFKHKKCGITHRAAVRAAVLVFCCFQVLGFSVPAFAASTAPLSESHLEAPTPTLAPAPSPDPVKVVELSITANGYLKPNFSSALPLIIFDSTEADTPPNYENNFFLETVISSSDDSTENTLASAAPADPKSGVHNLTDRENTSSDEKFDYFVRFDEATPLLGLSSTCEFFVLGAKDDKSLIRNYIGYSMAAAIFADSPEVRLCELIIRDGEGYRYQGVYLLVAVKPLPAGLPLQRSTGSVEMVLETYADHNDETVGQLTIPLMEKAGWDDSYNDVIGKLSWTEEVLYNTDTRTFYQYQDMIDVESFVNAFILGELTENYSWLNNAYYYYTSDTDLISYTPLWSFEHAIDNDAESPVTINGMYFTDATYIRQLFKSPSFANQIKTTYLQLRREALSEQTIMKLADDAAALVSTAVNRDWSRWDNYRHVQMRPLTELRIDADTTLKIEPFSRQSDSYENELLRIKTQLREHSLHFAVNVTQFDFQEREISKEIVLNSNPIWIVVFIVVFFVIVRFVRMYGV